MNTRILPSPLPECGVRVQSSLLAIASRAPDSRRQDLSTKIQANSQVWLTGKQEDLNKDERGGLRYYALFNRHRRGLSGLAEVVLPIGRRFAYSFSDRDAGPRGS